MKKLLFLTLLPLLSYSQERFTQDISAQNSVEFCADCKADFGVTPFTIWVKHRREENALKKAKRAAVKAVMTQGIPGSAVSQPLVTYTQYEQKKKFLDDFLDSDACESFVSKATINPEKTYKIKSGPFKNGFEAGVEVEVQYDNLKRFLTQNKIIKFGL